MDVVALEEIKQQWLFAADAMPQLICLVDRDGRIIRANRTLERWELGQVENVRGAYLHRVLHKHCADPDCYLHTLRERTAEALAKDGRAACDVWDPLLERHFSIHIQRPVPQGGAGPEAFFALVSIDDVTELKAGEDQSRRTAQALNRRVEREEQKREQAEKFQAHLLTVLDKTPVFIAMADRSGALFYLNPAGRLRMGLAQDEALTGLTLLNCHAAGERSRIAEEALPAVERDDVWSGDSVLCSRDGHEIKSNLTLIGHRDACGALAGYCLLGSDMSDWVRTEEAFRLTQNEMWRLSAQHLTIQESERRRIAADLHDGLGQTLSLMKLSIEDVSRSLQHGAAGKAAATLEHLATSVKSALAELRRMSMNLRPATLDDLGILATLAWYFREFEIACPGIKLERDISAKESDVPEPLKIAIFRIVQEATNNTVKHAGAERIKVSLCNEGDFLELLIEDTGRGFDATAVGDRRGFDQGLGLQSMKERAELSGARYEIHSAPGKGTSICVRWPSTDTLAREFSALPQFAIDAVVKAPTDRELSERMSVCVACMRTFRS